ncbi:hypothetical protein JK358_06770 [Nocardia sp. 2]|uniref:DUF7373 domain-containing protein n=1 Tax=Nocardia acididurans TaxID=2802282 RepID=A0ABS1M2N8_9NOCA|nr:hypothetical protein [Nocardia acididurans]MBL1074094.1 hypothetical protein [Nocardia acididurans]
MYGPAYFTHNAPDQTLVGRLMSDNGTDRIGIVDGTAIMRTRDTAAALALSSGLANNLGTAFDPIAGPETVPAVRCFERASAAAAGLPYRCYVAYKRYAAIVTSDSEQDLKRKTAAQYALLANSL